MQSGSIINIVICYNNANEVKEYAKELNKQNNIEDFALIIVINEGTNNDISILNTIEQEIIFKVIIINAKKNLGYMKGMLYGYKIYRKKYGIPQYIIMGNTDIEIPDMDFLYKLKNTKYEKDIWCIGPSIFTKFTNNYDNPVAFERRSKREINNLMCRFGMPVFNSCYVGLSSIKAFLIKKNKLQSQYVYEVHGCFFIIRSECADKMLKRPFKPLMYSEETYVAEIVYGNQKKEYYDSNLEIIHKEHTTTALLGNKKIAKYLYESMRFIRNEFYKDE